MHLHIERCVQFAVRNERKWCTMQCAINTNSRRNRIKRARQSICIQNEKDTLMESLATIAFENVFLGGFSPSSQRRIPISRLTFAQRTSVTLHSPKLLMWAVTHCNSIRVGKKRILWFFALGKKSSPTKQIESRSYDITKELHFQMTKGKQIAWLPSARNGMPKIVKRIDN